MKFHRTASSKPGRTQKHQMGASAPDEASDLVQFPGGAQASEPGNQAPAAQAAADQPFVIRSANVKGDPFSCLPPIYDPNASFVVDSAPSEIRELLSPEPEDSGPASEPDGP